MPWVRKNDGLAMDGIPHYDQSQIGHLINQLRGVPNKPKRVCDMLEELLNSHKATRALVWRLSKWCHWRNKSAEETAQSIAEGFSTVLSAGDCSINETNLYLMRQLPRPITRHG